MFRASPRPQGLSPPLPPPNPSLTPQRIHLNYIMNNLVQSHNYFVNFSFSSFCTFRIFGYVLMPVNSIYQHPRWYQHCWISKYWFFFLYHILAKYICSYLVTTLVSSEEARNPTGTQSRIDLHAIFLTDELTEKNQMKNFFKTKKKVWE